MQLELKRSIHERDLAIVEKKQLESIQLKVHLFTEWPIRPFVSLLGRTKRRIPSGTDLTRQSVNPGEQRVACWAREDSSHSFGTSRRSAISEECSSLLLAHPDGQAIRSIAITRRSGRFHSRWMSESDRRASADEQRLVYGLARIESEQTCHPSACESIVCWTVDSVCRSTIDGLRSGDIVVVVASSRGTNEHSRRSDEHLMFISFSLFILELLTSITTFGMFSKERDVQLIGGRVKWLANQSLHVFQSIGWVLNLHQFVMVYLNRRTSIECTSSAEKNWLARICIPENSTAGLGEPPSRRWSSSTESCLDSPNISKQF